MLPERATIEAMRADFRWSVPKSFNLAHATCDRHANADNSTALIIDNGDGRIERTGFLELQRLSMQLANALHGLGLRRGDRLGIFLGQHRATLLGHLAAARLGAVSVPLFRLFGPDALQYRLFDSGARMLITDCAGAETITTIRDALPSLDTVFVVDADKNTPPGGFLDFATTIACASDRHRMVETHADDPMFIIYTSGTTGPPKGAVHGHRALIGHLPGVQMPHEMFPQAGDRFWTPADWAWIGGLLDVLFPSLHFGVPVVGGMAGRFDPEFACDLMARHDVRNVFFPPAALRAIRDAGVRPRDRGVRLRSIGSGGERLGDALHGWAHEAFDVAVNEFYGQTEANLIVSGMASRFEREGDAIGMAVPGHEVAVLDETATPVSPGKIGEIALKVHDGQGGQTDPVVFLGYWKNKEATAAKYAGPWLLTGDLGRMSESGHVTFEGRKDDLINIKGYRIGPLEIEACLERHPTIARAAVIATEDAAGQGRIHAFVVPADPGAAPPALETILRDHVQRHLARHMAPHAVHVVEALPQTATGKLQRSKLRSLV